MTKALIWLGFMLLGALIISPAIAMAGFDPLPGDFHIDVGNTHVYVPLATSFLVSGSLTLLFFFLRR